jgi:hypothetical protein
MKRLFLIFSAFWVTQSAFAEFTCDDTNKYRAIYDANSYTCQSGEFLPANTLGCQSCPTGMSCSGGTFDFNPDNFQGLTINNISTTTLNNMCADNMFNKLRASYEPNQYTCNPGYYLPANAIACVICPVDSYCVGGTYTFNETVPQGIVSCGAGLFAPSGMSSSNQCGRILHIGDNVVYLHSVKKTTPALHVDIDQDGTADYFGNMTTLDVPMTRGTERKLKLQYDGVTYSVYDDSVDLSEYTN